jgi:hypothetical protein
MPVAALCCSWPRRRWLNFGGAVSSAERALSEICIILALNPANKSVLPSLFRDCICGCNKLLPVGRATSSDSTQSRHLLFEKDHVEHWRRLENPTSTLCQGTELDLHLKLQMGQRREYKREHKAVARRRMDGAFYQTSDARNRTRRIRRDKHNGNFACGWNKAQ